MILLQKCIANGFILEIRNQEEKYQWPGIGEIISIFCVLIFHDCLLCIKFLYQIDQ